MEIQLLSELKRASEMEINLDQGRFTFDALTFIIREGGREL